MYKIEKVSNCHEGLLVTHTASHLAYHMQLKGSTACEVFYRDFGNRLVCILVGRAGWDTYIRSCFLEIFNITTYKTLYGLCFMCL